MKFSLYRTKSHGPVARRAALGAAMVLATLGAACSSNEGNLVSPDDTASDRFSFRRTPSAPQNVAATAGDQSATVTWAAPASSGAARVYSYTVVTSPGGRSTRVSASATSANISGLTNGSAYTFTVYAANFYGSGPGAKTNAVTPAAPTTPPDTTTPTPPDTTTPPPAAVAPTAPTAVHATAGNASASVSWTAPSNPGSSAIASYTVTSAPGGATMTVNGQTTSATLGSLTNGTSYTFTVTAKNSSLTSPGSAPSNAVTPAAPPPAATAPGVVTSVSATAGNAQATITWQAPSSNGGSAITGYTVTSSPGSITANVTATTATISGLSNGTSYTFAVVAKNAVGSSAPVNSNAVTPSAPVTPPASGKWISGYWVGYNRGLQNENQIDMSQLTHIMVGRADVVNGNQIATTFFSGSNTTGASIAKTITSRAHAAGKKAIMMIGGSDAVASLRTASSSANRAGFITNLLSAMDAMSFDGIDVDWEPIATADQPNMLALVQGLRNARPNMIITMPISWVYYDANSWYGTIAPYVDQINFMSYEMDSNYDGWVSWHFSAVLGGEAANHPSSISRSLSAWKGAGVAAAKLGAGVGAYGHCWKGPSAPNQSLSGASWTGGDNSLTYTKIMAQYYNTSLYKWDASAQGAYLSAGGSTFGPGACTYLTYESPEAVTAKGQYVKAQGMGGIMFWTIDQQFNAGASGVAQNPLINAAYIGLNQ